MTEITVWNSLFLKAQNEISLTVPCLKASIITSRTSCSSVVYCLKFHIHLLGSLLMWLKGFSKSKVIVYMSYIKCAQ